jgi:hypothetical protein
MRILLDIGNEVPPALRPPSLPNTLTALWDLLESCWAVYPAGRPTAEDVMNSYRQWHQAYFLKQSPPVQDIADSFAEPPVAEKNKSSNRDISASSIPKENSGGSITLIGQPSSAQNFAATQYRPTEDNERTETPKHRSTDLSNEKKREPGLLSSAKLAGQGGHNEDASTAIHRLPPAAHLASQSIPSEDVSPVFEIAWVIVLLT